MKKALLIPVFIGTLLLIALPAPWHGIYAKSTNGLVVLLTDYGQRDYYVGALKGAIYATYPKARIDDISHDVTPFDIWEGAYTLLLAAKEFPEGTVFVAVVDPGVGTNRRNMVLETKDGKFFVAPDNGLLTFVAEGMGVANVREIRNRALMRAMESFSSTFHGREILGPVGAHLAAGVPMDRLGPEMKDFVRLKIPRAQVRDGRISGQVVRIDRYGNVVTNITEHHLQEAGIKRGDQLSVSLGGKRLEVRLVSTYGDVPEGERLCHLESHKFLEVAINLANLAKTLGVSVGDEVVVCRAGNKKEK